LSRREFLFKEARRKCVHRRGKGVVDIPGFLRRAGDTAGLNGWTAWLNNKTYTLDQVVNSFITSPEYLARF
jgi:hypothetical protein